MNLGFLVWLWENGFPALCLSFLVFTKLIPMTIYEASALRQTLLLVASPSASLEKAAGGGVLPILRTSNRGLARGGDGSHDPLVKKSCSQAPSWALSTRELERRGWCGIRQIHPQLSSPGRRVTHTGRLRTATIPAPHLMRALSRHGSPLCIPPRDPRPALAGAGARPRLCMTCAPPPLPSWS